MYDYFLGSSIKQKESLETLKDLLKIDDEKGAYQVEYIPYYLKFIHPDLIKGYNKNEHTR